MSLTREQRDALPDSDFAIPGQRRLPLHDDRHVRMARSQIDAMKGLTAAERAEGKARIAARVAALGIDEVRITFEMQAMAIAVPEEAHPNRLPFTGILTRVDEPSDNPPGGANGKRVYIPSPVAEAALDTLALMGVDCTEDFSGHDARFKIGVITEARIKGNAVEIAGFLYRDDFPEECARIQKEKSSLGFSYECKVSISDMDADPWVVDRIIFTGAAILYKEKAAYRTTSLAATAAQETAMTADELKKLHDTLAALAASVTSISDKVNKLEAGKGASLAGPIIDQAMPHVGACNAAADAMEAAGIGTHPTRGHAAVLRRVGAHILHGATMGKLPHIFNDHSYFEHGMEASAEDKAAKAKQEADLKALQDTIAGLNTQLADLKAAAAKTTETAPARKTAPGKSLLDKYGLQATDDATISIGVVDKALEAAGVRGVKAIEAKLAMHQQGIQIVR
jgi:cell division protein FtsB